MTTEGNSLSMSIRLQEESGEVRVIVAIHEDDDENEILAWVALPPEVAAEVVTGLMARCLEARQLEWEIESLSPGQRSAGLRAIYDRLHSPLN